ncbi:OB-fold-containig protein [Sphingobacterium sp.]|uniref:OB-fold-containig protein n=1 Tax=Sphingobacterium sp. TaxID=341027 RepID=UPI0028A11646|nr:OB-fold-containig protein [Sphingobacterium sp.]
MTELINILFNPLSNGIMTVLTGLSVVYWLFMFLMGDGVNLFDADADIDLHPTPDVTDVDGTHDIAHEGSDHANHHHTNTDSHGEPGFFTKAMDYINVGKVPIMLIVTLFKFIGWIITIVSSLFINVASWGIKSVLILIPVFIITFILMHFLTKPLARMFKNIGYNGEEGHDFLGRMGKMRASIEGKKIGSAEFIIQQDPIRLNVVSHNGEKIAYGDDVIIVDESRDKKYYYVTKEITIDNIQN